MDIIQSCTEAIEKRLGELDNYFVGQISTGHESQEFVQTQTVIDAVVGDRNKNFDRILEQQNHIKGIIERDGRIKSLRKAIIENRKTIDTLRKSCSSIGLEALKRRQELLESQATERERFQMQQLKSIAEDYRRHQEILEQRKKEITALKKETESEEKTREAFLADVEKQLQRELQIRQQMRQTGSYPMSAGPSIDDELNNPDHIELTSIDEYAPYGAAPHSRIRGASAIRGRGGGRGRKKRGM